MAATNGRRTRPIRWCWGIAALAVFLLLPTLGAGVGSAIPSASASVVAPLPGDFMFGVSSSGFQSEGYSPDSNWRRYSADPANTKDRVGNSVDFFHRYREDIDRARDLGTNVYRIGIEWARVEPRPGFFDPQALAFYDNVIAAIRAAGMRPMLTLDHWVYPGWLVDRGGWRNADTTNLWLTYARHIVDRYAPADPMWITFNEPLMYGYNEVSTGGLSPADLPMFYDKLVTAHRTIYDYIHARQPRAMVTSNSAYIPAAEPVIDTTFHDRVADKVDFMGLDYYYTVAPTETSAWNALTGDMWKAPINADGLYYSLRFYARHYPGKPLYVVESGMPTENGKPRPDGYRRGDHLRDLVYWLQRAHQDGIPVIGYNYWSLTDNYEWGSYTPRFGLYTVDVKTDPALTRRLTDAVAAYHDLIAGHGNAANYRPTRPPTTCSLIDVPSSCIEPVR
ncbi:family 1 glycosylhydrolase [Gordonia sp. DT30]|uniref:family 1 glycosylhydrolase n=1 Tax=unclassified Gordonia (in: high G+C Gram-positive bacteria) TaxID=2657482 RepID=UPI003CF45E4E